MNSDVSLFILCSEVGDARTEQDILKDFDLNTKYGPCCGISRIKRYGLVLALMCHLPKNFPCLAYDRL